MINTQPNTQLVRDALLQGETVAGASSNAEGTSELQPSVAASLI